MSPNGERIAAIDVGSNTILLTIADYHQEHGLEVIEEGEDQPRLAAGLTRSGRLSEEAMRQALGTLARMLERCRSQSVRRISAVATAAAREAANGGEFVQRVRALDIPLRVISPEEEAALSFRSAAYRFPDAGRMIVADIGGGSLELIGAAAGNVEVTLSLPLGAVRLTELRSTTEKIQEEIRQALAAAIPGKHWRSAKLIGSGGTFATLASIILSRRGAKSNQIHGMTASMDEVQQLLESLSRMSLDQRREVPGLKPERADIIVAGLAVIAGLLRVVGAEKVTVSGFGLRDGLLLEMAGLG